MTEIGGEKEREKVNWKRAAGGRESRKIGIVRGRESISRVATRPENQERGPIVLGQSIKGCIVLRRIHTAAITTRSLAHFGTRSIPDFVRSNGSREEGCSPNGSIAEDAWTSIVPEVGSVLEFHLDTSSLVTNGDDSWAALLIDVVEVDGFEGWKIKGRFLGTESSALEGEVAKYLEGPGLHICSTSPCVAGGVEERLCVTSIRWWRPSNFVAGYLNREGQRLLKELEDAEEKGPEKEEKRPPVKGRTPKASGRRVRGG